MYTYKGNTYEIINEARMKNPINRIWQDCVIYKQLENGNTYVREKEEFYSLFQPIAMHVPYHIAAMAKLFSTIKADDNLATGEVRKFLASVDIPIGAQIVSLETINNEDYDALWIHVANHYFKMIGLWPVAIM